MTYREQLNKVNELGINICDLTIANECNCVFEFPYTEEQFETLCEFALYIYLKTEDLSENDIAIAINDLIKNGDYTIEEVCEMNKREFVEFVEFKVSL